MDYKNPNSSHGKKSLPNKQTSPRATLFVVSAVQFLTPFLASSVSVALPSIGREFAASTFQLSLVQLIYILAVSALLLPIGRYADINGRKKIFILGISLLTLSTILVTFSFNMTSFIIFRFFQGSGAAMITSTSVAILSSVFPKEKRGKAMGIIIAFVYVGLAAGPTLSGFLITQLGWRWIFWAILPVEISALILTLLKLHGDWKIENAAFDLTGTVIYIPSLSAIMTGGSLLGRSGFAPFLCAAGVAGMIFFVIFQARTRHPLLNVRLLATNLRFTFNNLATLINYAASFGILFLFSIYLQEVKLYSAQQAGLILICQPVIQACIAPFAGKLSDKYPPAIISTCGMLLCTVGLSFSASISLSTSFYTIITILIIMGCGFGLFSSPNMVAIMGSVGPEQYGVASSVVATMRSLGMLVSMALITVLVSNIIGDHAITADNKDLFISTMRIAFICFTLLSVAGTLLSFLKELQLFRKAH